MNKKRKFPDAYFGPIAHRGLHDETKPENSLAAFKAAIEANLPFELDVHLTKDGKLVVCHDSDLKRMSGKEGIIEELDYETIRSSYSLPDGSHLPLLDEVLELNKERSLMVLELKVWKSNWIALSKAAKKILKKIKDNKKVVVICFDPRALGAMGKRFPKSFLVCQSHWKAWKFHSLFDSVDIETCLLDKKEVLRYKEKGGLINVWTVNDEDSLQKAARIAQTITFENLPPELVEKEMKKAESL